MLKSNKLLDKLRVFSPEHDSKLESSDKAPASSFSARSIELKTGEHLVFDREETEPDKFEAFRERDSRLGSLKRVDEIDWKSVSRGTELRLIEDTLFWEQSTPVKLQVEVFGSQFWRVSGEEREDLKERRSWESGEDRERVGER